MNQNKHFQTWNLTSSHISFPFSSYFTQLYIPFPVAVPHLMDNPAKIEPNKAKILVIDPLILVLERVTYVL